MDFMDHEDGWDQAYDSKQKLEPACCCENDKHDKCLFAEMGVKEDCPFKGIKQVQKPY